MDDRAKGTFYEVVPSEEQEVQAMLDVAKKLKIEVREGSTGISKDVAQALRGRIGHLLNAIAEYAENGDATEYRASDVAWQDLASEAIALREMMNYV